ncbi:methyl-accepting chemotaxis protein [Alteromonas sp. MYP5]|uniref:Methyl-accepting chemotaxis protein n=1 Tax=Alteromonas ponticola TaxID=2720613 RepID=A0ABX1R2J9_9ALTE|nr:methyl-accepting chemotaxis protein [Alteromonas ponticola]
MSLSIKQKFLFTLLIAVLLSCLLVSVVSQWIARDLVKQDVEQQLLPSKVKQIANRVEKEVGVMLTVAHSIATNPYMIEWSAAGANKAEEQKLVNYLHQLAEQNELAAASFVDRQTYNYWNQDGFLRKLKNDEFDGWFFAYKESGNPTSLSLYNEPGVGYRLFANYQQTNGRGMSGVAKAVDELLTIINRVKLAKSGFMYLVDAQGNIIAHPDTSLLGKRKLADVSDSATQTTLLTKADFNLANIEVEGQNLLMASAYIPEANWYVIAQVPEAELYSDLNDANLMVFIWAIVIAIIFAFVGRLLANNISRPLEKLADAFQELGRGEGDLSTRLAIPEQKETARLVEGFNKFIASLHATISTVAKTSTQLRGSAQEVAQKSHQTQDNSKLQRDHTIQVATALTQMGSTVTEVAQSASSAAEKATVANTTSEQGRQLTQEAVKSINRLSAQIEGVAKVIQSLDDHTSAIGGILDTIRGISEQTNLLALNAAIESARAGEHGRGFSVVADEVRTLAQRAASATDEIQVKIDMFQQDSREAVVQMKSSREQSSLVVQSAKALDEILQKIALEIDGINEINTQVAAATEEQTVVVEDINVNIHEISDTSEDTLKTASSLVIVSDKLDKLASELAAQVNRFKL